MKGHPCPVNPHSVDVLQKLPRKMQTRRRGRHRPLPEGEDRLILLSPIPIAANVGGQRHTSEGVQKVQDVLASRSDPDDANPIVLLRLDPEDPVPYQDLRPRPQLAPRPDQGPPYLEVRGTWAQKKHLRGTSAGQAFSQQPCGQYARIVQDQEIVWPQIPKDITEPAMFDRSVPDAPAQEAGRVPRLRGSLSDSPLGQEIVVGIQVEEILVRKGPSLDGFHRDSTHREFFTWVPG